MQAYLKFSTKSLKIRPARSRTVEPEGRTKGVFLSVSLLDQNVSGRRDGRVFFAVHPLPPDE
jgi:hypothetical protein